VLSDDCLLYFHCLVSDATDRREIRFLTEIKRSNHLFVTKAAGEIISIVQSHCLSLLVIVINKWSPASAERPRDA